MYSGYPESLQRWTNVNIIKIAGVTCSSDFQKIDKTKQRELTEQREQRHACMTFVESRRKSIESSIRPVARVGRISAPAGASDRH
jgi:hypothetical protein